MAIVKTTASGGNLPEKKITPSTTTAKTASRTGGVAVRQGVKPTDSKTFLNDTAAELRRVVWPTRDEVRSGVIVTIGLLVFFSLYIYGIDQLVGKIFTLLGLYADQS
jgi:preprotein translocase SecE subunit